MRTASHSPAASLGASHRWPPGPRGSILAGNLELFEDPLGVFTRGHAEFGDVVAFRIGPFRLLSVADPSLAQHVLVRNHRNYVKSRSYAGLRLLLGNGLVTSEGEHWRRQRKLAQPAFHRQRLAGLARTMAECVNERLEQWDARPNAEVDVHTEMMQLTLRIVGRTLFGTDLGADLGALGPAVTVCLEKANKHAESLIRLPLWLPTRSNRAFNRSLRVLDDSVHRIIDRRRRSGEQMDDLLGMLMSATDETGTERMSDADLRDEVMTLFLAGHETIANAMSWTWKLLTEHPEVAERIREEVRQAVGDRAPGFEDLPKLVYTGWVIDEVLRLYPPAWIVEREALAEDRLGAWKIPARTIVAVSPYAIHRHPGLWDHAARFDPERFSPQRAESRPKHAYIPFGAGPRVCIGNHFALMEAKIVLATMLQRYDIRVHRPEAIVPDPQITLRPRGGMPARLQRRSA